MSLAFGILAVIGRMRLWLPLRLGTRLSLKRSLRGDSSGEFKQPGLASGKRKLLQKARLAGVRVCDWQGLTLREVTILIVTKYLAYSFRRAVRKVIPATWSECG
jgi:hypothetical protein